MTPRVSANTAKLLLVLKTGKKIAWYSLMPIAGPHPDIATAAWRLTLLPASYYRTANEGRTGGLSRRGGLSANGRGGVMGGHLGGLVPTIGRVGSWGDMARASWQVNEGSLSQRIRSKSLMTGQR